MKFLKNIFRRGPKPLDNVTVRIQRIFLAARNEADRRYHTYVGVDHLWGGLLRINEGVAIDILKSRGIDLSALRSEYEAKMTPPATPKEPKRLMPFTSEFSAVLKSGNAEAAKLGVTHFGTEHLLLGLISRRGMAREALRKHGLDLNEARSEVAKRITELNQSPAPTAMAVTPPPAQEPRQP